MYLFWFGEFVGDYNLTAPLAPAYKRRNDLLIDTVYRFVEPIVVINKSISTDRIASCIRLARSRSNIVAQLDQTRLVAFAVLAADANMQPNALLLCFAE